VVEDALGESLAPRVGPQICRETCEEEDIGEEEEGRGAVPAEPALPGHHIDKGTPSSAQEPAAMLSAGHLCHQWPGELGWSRHQQPSPRPLTAAGGLLRWQQTP